jgi:hypothetical protein
MAEPWPARESEPVAAAESAVDLDESVDGETEDDAAVEEPAVEEPAAEAPVPAPAMNGTALNGTSPNGTSPNGTSPNGTAPNGTAMNGVLRPLDTLSAVINANIRLPQREPGTSAQPSPLTSLLAQRTAARERDAIPTEVIEPTPEPDVSVTLEDEVEVPETLDADLLASVTELHEPVPDEPAVVGPPSPLGLDSPANALDGHADDDETPLFRMLRSGWFTASGDQRGFDTGGADAGWQAADRASDSAPSRLTQSGLPVRDPGNRLVPGGVERPAPVARRDPAAIKARLAAHAAGVARGRSVAGDPYPDSSTADPTEDVTP